MPHTFLQSSEPVMPYGNQPMGQNYQMGAPGSGPPPSMHKPQPVQPPPQSAASSSGGQKSSKQPMSAQQTASSSAEHKPGFKSLSAGTSHATVQPQVPSPKNGLPKKGYIHVCDVFIVYFITYIM